MFFLHNCSVINIIKYVGRSESSRPDYDCIKYNFVFKQINLEKLFKPRIFNKDDIIFVANKTLCENPIHFKLFTTTILNNN